MPTRRLTGSMLYKDNYFGKEFRQGYTENEISTARKTAFGLFAGLFSFALYFIFLLLKESVLYDTVPEIMQTSSIFTSTPPSYCTLFISWSIMSLFSFTR